MSKKCTYRRHYRKRLLHSRVPQKTRSALVLAADGLIYERVLSCGRRE